MLQGTSPMPPASTRARRVSAVKDPNAPKKPPSAYFLWAMANRPLIAQELGNSSPKVVAPEAAKRWNELPQKLRAVWVTKAADLKKEFIENMEAYKLTEQHAAFQAQKLAAQSTEGLQAECQREGNVAAGGTNLTNAPLTDLVMELGRRLGFAITTGKSAGEDAEAKQTSPGPVAKEGRRDADLKQTSPSRNNAASRSPSLASAPAPSTPKRRVESPNSGVMYDSPKRTKAPPPAGFTAWFQKRREKIAEESGLLQNKALRAEGMRRWGALPEHVHEKWAAREANVEAAVGGA